MNFILFLRDYYYQHIVQFVDLFMAYLLVTIWGEERNVHRKNFGNNKRGNDET